jgi:hypothetical protein
MEKLRRLALRLARWLGLSTLTEAIVEVTGVPPIELEPGRLAQPGPAFITRAENGSPWDGQVAGVLDALVNPEDLARMVAFDTWIRNCDRCLARPGQEAHVNRDNVFLSTEGVPQGRFAMKPIDHAQSFCFATEFTPALLRAAAAVEDDRRFGYFPEFRELVTEADLKRAVAQIGTIRREEIEALFTDVPPAWGIGPEIRIAWCDLIAGRAIFLARNADRLCSNL